MRKIKLLFGGFLLGMALMLLGCGKEKEILPVPPAPLWEEQENTTWDESKTKLKIVQITDPHFYSSRLTDGGERYQKIMKNAAGRDALEIDKILEQFAVDIKEEVKPDVLIISGDMTLNGERKSHEDFTEYLGKLETAGIQVLVIPGNHDINNTYACEIYDTGLQKAETVTPEEFLKLYEDFGYSKALDRDTDSLSYVAAVSEDMWALMLDTCVYENGNLEIGNLSPKTRQWIFSVLEKAGQQGKQIISVTHHNLLTHNAYFSDSYTVANSKRFVEELALSGVSLNLSGHMHIMHIEEKNGFYDAALESLAVWPNQYALLELNEQGDMYYHTRFVRYEGNSHYYLFKTNWDRTYNKLEKYGLEEKERKAMADFMTIVNRDYFSGRMEKREVYEGHPGYELWMKLSEEEFSTEYIKEMLNNAPSDDTCLFIPKK